jgi:hypothetical protein
MWMLLYHKFLSAARKTGEDRAWSLELEKTARFKLEWITHRGTFAQDNLFGGWWADVADGKNH